MNWKNISGFESYKISDTGLVKSGDRPLKGLPNSKGYLRVNLYKNKKRKSITIASLVLEHFVGPRPPGLVASHTNGIKTDNRVENLKWVTQQENIGHQVAHGSRLRGTKLQWAKLTESDVEFIRLNARLGRKENNIRELAERFGVDRNTIYAALRARYWKHVPHTASEVSE